MMPLPDHFRKMFCRTIHTIVVNSVNNMEHGRELGVVFTKMDSDLDGSSANPEWGVPVPYWSFNLI